MRYNLFVIEDDRDTIELLKEIFSEQEYCLRCFSSSIKALQVLKEEGLPDLVLLDLMMPQMDGITFLEQVRKMSASLPVIMITAHGSIETAVDALKKGASDYITKPFSFEELRLAVTNVLELNRLRRKVEAINRDRRGRYAPATLMGEHEELRNIREMLLQVAAATTTCVLLRGESGTGKNQAARIIHYNSPLAEGSFVELNCAAMPASLLEAELFGYRKGAFTGASSHKQGIIEQARGGTLFLDEIAEIPLELQSKLLSFLESKKLRRIGEVTEREVDARLIAASNRDLEQLVAEGKFRQDLLFRINVINCYLPPLRRLGRDMLLIAEKFIAEFNQQFHKQLRGLDHGAEIKLLAHSWPGNVRELRNVIERAMLFATGPRLEASDIQLTFAGESTAKVEAGFRIPPDGLDWEEHEKNILTQALERCGNNQTAAAKLLSISRDTFIYRLKKYGII
jgi:two-component system response regulator AtoC